MLTDVKRRGIDSQLVDRGARRNAAHAHHRRAHPVRRRARAGESASSCTTRAPARVVVMNPYNGEILAMANYPTFDPNEPPKPREDPAARFNLARVGAVRAGLRVQGDHAVGGARNHQPAAGIAHQLRQRSAAPARPRDSRSAPRLRHAAHGAMCWRNRATSARSRSACEWASRTCTNTCGASASADDGHAAAGGIGRHVAASWTGGARRRWLRSPWATKSARPRCNWRRPARSIANGGLLVKPRLILKEGGQPTPSRAAGAHPAAGDRHHDAPDDGRRGVCAAPATGARLEGYTSGGKTGSAQIFDVKAHHYTHKYNASFMGFAPVTNPAIVIVVTLNGTSGGAGMRRRAAAAPVFKAVATEALRVLDVPKDLPDADAGDRQRMTARKTPTTWRSPIWARASPT